jgi:hypothetical protein
MFMYARKPCQAPLIGRAFLSPFAPGAGKTNQQRGRICIADRAQLNRNHGVFGKNRQAWWLETGEEPRTLQRLRLLARPDVSE